MINLIDIRAYEAMAMFDLPEDEREDLGRRFGDLAGGLTALEQIDTDNTEPLVTVLDLRNILRGDVSEKLITRDELLSSAPEQYDGYFKVPGTLE